MVGTDKNLEVLEPEKKGLGTKIKELFTGKKEEERHLQTETML